MARRRRQQGMPSSPVIGHTDWTRVRHERLGTLIERHGLDVIVLRHPANFAWLTGGAESRVDRALESGVAELVVTPDDVSVRTTNIEAERFRTEQTPWAEVVSYPWHEGPPATQGPTGSDLPEANELDVGDEVAALRRVLDPDAVERLRTVGADARAAIEEVASEVRRGLSEHEAAGLLSEACERRGLFPSVLLAAADERIAAHRHPLPHDGVIQRRAMLVVSAERGGLYANLTRLVELEDLPPETARRVAATNEILGGMRDATRPGRHLSEVFEDCRRLYALVGYPDEWQLHHQGGSTGYRSREVIATPHTHDLIQVNQAFAWNPSITGAKAEETFVLTEAGPEVVTGA
jgi:Xaa-Pro dipeptidase